MPQLLLELFSEEIPARMQSAAARDLERMARERLTAAGFGAATLRAFAGPRRLTLVVDDLPTAQADRDEEVKGPRVGAPPQAMDGFLKKVGLAQSDLTERDGVYYARLSAKGRPTTEIVAEMVEAIVRGFPWPKSMKWGTSTLRWVRPLQRILCVFDGAVVPFSIDGVESGDLTEGHRFMGADRAPVAVRDFKSYEDALDARFVVIEAEERKRRILDGARKLCAAKGLELVEDEGLLEEVAGLAEWPTPILGDMEPSFLDLPPEVIRTSMRTHQKYFAVRDPVAGGLAPHFIVVANIEAIDGGKAVAAGNARVLSARLNDARFFWDEDIKAGFEPWLEKLNGVTFHARLGTMAERVTRIAALARELAPAVGVDADTAAEAARLAKADLASQMVGEFPELQGVMGGYYARAAIGAVHAGPRRYGEEVDPQAVPRGDRPALSTAIADAIRDHYRPQGPNDSVPTTPLSVVVALADKLDTLVGFFAIDEKPTGSKDPYALRRAALGVIRICQDNGLRLSMKRLISSTVRGHVTQSSLPSNVGNISEEFYSAMKGDRGDLIEKMLIDLRELYDKNYILKRYAEATLGPLPSMEWFKDYKRVPEEVANRIASYIAQSTLLTTAIKYPNDELGFEAKGWLAREEQDILTFFADRLKVLLRDQGKRHDLVDAVFALGDDDLVRIVARVEALDAFLATDDGANLLAGYKRATNILRAEEKKGPLPTGMVQLGLAGQVEEEAALAMAVQAATVAVESLLAAEDFAGAMAALARLRGPVDAFFDKVLVNSDVPAERENRLKLLGQVRDLVGRVADFSLIAG
jgi:glycyl-tRNA synthetase beta chain